MALLKEISVRGSGVNASYWRVMGFNVDFAANIAIITLAGYVSQELRNSGANPIIKKKVRWVGSENPITPEQMVAGNAFTAAYTKLVAAETNPLNPPNPFEGGVQV